MSGELGLFNSYRERIHEPFQAYLGNDGAAGREIDLISFINEQLGLTNAAGKPWTMEDIFCDLGMDPNIVTIGNLVSLSGDVKYLAPELIRQFILMGMVADVSYLDLVAGSENASSLDVTAPWIQYNEAEMQDIAEGETIPESAIEWGFKTVRLSKSGVAIKLTDELVLSVALPVLQYWLQRVGAELQGKVFKKALTTMVNGDQAGGADSAAIIGVASAGTLAFADFTRPWVRARRIGMNWNNMATSENMANTVLALTEFKPTVGGTGPAAVTLDSRNRIIPTSMPHLIGGTELTDNQLMLYDKRAAMIHMTFRGLLVESERIIMRQINGTAASVMDGFLTIDRKARIIIDKSLAFAQNGFPTYMNPLVA
jgi:hypothetical protein